MAIGGQIEDIDELTGRLEASEDIRLEVSARLAEAEGRLAEAEERASQAAAEAAEAVAAERSAAARLAEADAALADRDATLISRTAMLNQQVGGTMCTYGVFKYLSLSVITCALQNELQIVNLQQQLTDARSENNELISKLRDWGVSPSASPAQPPLPPPRTTLFPAIGQASTSDAAIESLTDFPLPVSTFEDRIQREALEGELRLALSRAAAAEAEVAALQSQSAREREKVRSDQVVLAKEIKKLRAELKAATEVSIEFIVETIMDS